MASIVTLFVVAASAQSQPQPSPKDDSPRPKETQATDNRQDETDALRAIAAEIRAINQRQAAQEQQGASNQPSYWNKVFAPETFSQWVLAFFAALAAGLAVKSLRGIEDQVIETRNAARAAKSSADTARANMYLSLRARMGLKQVLADNLGPNKPTGFNLVFENFGGKGAMLEDYCLEVTVLPLQARPAYITFKELGAPVEAKSHQILYRMIEPPLTQDQWDAITDESGTSRLKIFGVLRYRAGFGTKTKTVGFCREYDPTLSRFKGTQTFNTVGGPNYNYAD